VYMGQPNVWRSCLSWMLVIARANPIRWCGLVTCW
jgi:hypothetical protein